jgi:hypothetical protein
MAAFMDCSAACSNQAIKQLMGFRFVPILKEAVTRTF